MLQERRSPGADARAPLATPIANQQYTGESLQVSWWSTIEFLGQLLNQANVGRLPWAGSPAWCELADGDPRKLLALAVAGTHHALRVETAQQAVADASRAISASEDWGAISREIHHRNNFYAARPWLKRVIA